MGVKSVRCKFCNFMRFLAAALEIGQGGLKKGPFLTRRVDMVSTSISDGLSVWPLKLCLSMFTKVSFSSLVKQDIHKFCLHWVT